MGWHDNSSLVLHQMLRFESGGLHEIVKPALVAGFCVYGNQIVLSKMFYVFRMNCFWGSNPLEISIHSKFILFYKNFFKRTDIILFIEDQHGFFIFNRVNGAKWYGAIAVSN